MKVYTHKDYSYVHVAEIPKNEIQKFEFDVCKQPKETLDSYYSRQNNKPDLVVNAGFFDMSNGNPCFNYISDGKVISDYIYFKWGIGVVGDSDISYGEMSEKKWKGWISGFPNLLYDGEKIKIEFALELDYKARRTILGFNDENIYIVCVENPGMRFAQMQDLMLSIGCKYAINLDGGGSTKMLHNGKSVTKNATNRAVDNVIAVYLKNNKVLYRVQLGAFSIKQNAEKYLKTIKNIGSQYSTAYITKVDGLYKIQVGAFSIKKNAENMVNDLKSKGYSAFIVSTK